MRVPSSELEIICSEIAGTMNSVHSTDFSDRFWFDVLSNHVRISFRRKKTLCVNVSSKMVPLEEFDGLRLPSSKAMLARDRLIIARSLMRILSGTTSPPLNDQTENVLVGKRLSQLSIPNAVSWLPRAPLPILGSRKKRKKLEQIAYEQRDIFKRNILLQIPRLYVEYFSPILRQLITPNITTSLSFHVEHSDIFTKIALAYFREKGSRLVHYQLGGHFGEVEGHPHDGFYRRIEVLKTYGWCLHDKDDPFYAVRLEEFAHKYGRMGSNKNIDLLIIYNRLRGDRRAHYLTTTEYLSRNIDRKKFPKIVLRPRGASRKVSSRSNLDFLRQEISADVDQGKKDLSELCSRSNIVLHLEHPSTNFLECIFVNQPVIALLTNQKPTKLVLPHYEFFLEYGVMHPNIESLVKHLNEVDIDEWWKKVIAHEKCSQFKLLFARSKHQYEESSELMSSQI